MSLPLKRRLPWFRTRGVVRAMPNHGDRESARHHVPPQLSRVDRLALTAASALLGGLWPKIHTWSVVCTNVSGAALLEGQLLCDRREEFVDIDGGFGGGLKEEQTGLFGILFGIGGLDGALVGVVVDHIGLVSGQCNDNVLARLALEFLDPRFRLV